MGLLVKRFAVLALILLGAGAAQSPVARAEEVRVFAAGAVQKAVQPLVREFEAKTGHKVVATYDTVGSLRDKIIAGEKPHVVLVSATALKVLADQGRIVVESRRDVGRTGVGLMGHPDKFKGELDDLVATSEKLKAILLAAKSIAHADPARGATAGTHFRKVVGDLGLTDTLAQRITVVPFGGAIADEVAAGKFEVGVSQATEIVPNIKVRFLGFLPDPHQLWTVYGLAAVAEPTPASRDLIAALTSDAGKSAFGKIGFRP